MNSNKFLKFFCDLAMYWWCFWSSFRFRKSIRENIGIKDDDKIETYNNIQSEVTKLYKKFTWTEDGPDQLWDAITPPPQNYRYYLDGELKDDCDGFHSLVYHILYNNNIECYLLTANAKGSGHCILLFKWKDQWHVNDYYKLYKGFATAQEAIENYNEYYSKIYTSNKVFYNGLVKYDYDTKSFHVVGIKDLE